MRLKRLAVISACVLAVAGVGGFAFIKYMHLNDTAPVFASGELAIQGSRAENLAAFRANPVQYAPQFGMARMRWPTAIPHEPIPTPGTSRAASSI